MKILLVEDEPMAAHRLEEMVLSLRPNATIVAQPESVAETVEWLQANDHPDLILLDIQLADGTCFNIFEQVEVTAPVIFTTAYDEYALQAFKVNSIDYLLKPVKKDQLETALHKLEQQSAHLMADYAQLAAALQGKKSHKKRFLIRVGQRIQTVKTSEIAYFYSEAKSTFLCTSENRTYTLDESLDALEDMLPKDLFFRINRKFIVHLEAIAAMHTYSKSRVLLELQPPYHEKVIVSTDRSPHFKKWLADE